jgi:hypothetical protein
MDGAVPLADATRTGIGLERPDSAVVEPRHGATAPDGSSTRPEILIDYQWALDPATYEELRDQLPLLQRAVRTFEVPASRQPDEQLILQLESAGLHLDSLPKSTIGCAPARIAAGQATVRELAEAIEALANEPSSGGQIIDVCANPVRITEVRELNARTIVCVTPQGGRVIPPNARRIAGLLEE